MTKKLKIGLGILLALVVLYIMATFYINHKISSFLENDFLTSEVQVASVSCNLLTGSVSLKGLQANNKKEKTTTIKNLEINGVGYFKWIFQDSLVINEVKLADFEIQLPLEQQQDSTSTSSNTNLAIRVVSIKNGVVSKNENDANTLFANGLQVQINKLRLSTENVNQSLSYQIEAIKIDSTFLKLDDYQNLATSEISVTSDHIKISDINMETNSVKVKEINGDLVNKDIMTLTSPSLTIAAYQIAHGKEMKFTAQKIDINDPVFIINANNNLTPSKEVVRSYSEQLRDMDLKLNINEVNVNRGTVIYSEADTEKTTRGAITFEQIDASLSNFHNIKGNGFIKMHTDATFMNNSRFQTDYSMNPYDMTNAFKWSGRIGDFELNSLDSFLYPVFKMRLKGKVYQYFFSVYGNQRNYQADIKIKLNNAQIEFFNEDNEKKSLLSGLANLVATNSTDGDFVKKQSSIPVDQYATFFNQIWLVQRKALVEVLK